ncbi:MAG: integrin alpha, partial [Dehalococcoidia bacterium]
PQVVLDENREPVKLNIDIAFGDVDGDGETNLVLVAPNARGTPLGSGRAYVLGNPYLHQYGGQRWSREASDVFVGAVLGAVLNHVLLADYDGDGYPDLFFSQPGLALAILIAATQYTPEQFLAATAFATVFLLPGGPFFGGGGSLADAVTLGALLLLDYGGPMAFFDWTGDGEGDLLFGDEGSIGVIGGPLDSAVGAMLRLRFPGEPWFGKDIAGYGDFAREETDRCYRSCLGASAPTPDGPARIILIAPNFAYNLRAQQAELGSAQVESEFIDISPDDPTIVAIEGLRYGRLGYDMAFGDLNGDGVLDLVIGEPGAPSVAGMDPSDETGAVYVVLGPLEGGNIDEITVRRYTGIAAGDRFGGGVAIHDVNDDGIPDIHVTAAGVDESRGEDVGAFYTFLGAAPTITSVRASGDVLIIEGDNLDPNVFVDGERALIVSYSPTEMQVFAAGDAVEVRGVFGNASVALERVVELVPDWNLVGWSGATAVSEATASIAGQFSTLMTWDAAAKAFLRFDAAAPAIVNTLSELNSGDGVWLFVTDPAGAAWTQPAISGARSVDLLSGFNLVMWTGPDGMPVADAVAGLGDALNAVFRWDTEADEFLIYGPGRPDFLNTAKTLNSGEGLWIDVSRAIRWEQPAP